MSSQPKGDNEPGIVIAMMLGLLFFLLWIIWHNFKEPILEAMRWLRFIEVWVINLLTGEQADCLAWLRNARFNDPDPSPQIVRWTQQCFGSVSTGEGGDAYYRLSAVSMVAIEGFVTYYDHFLLAGLLAITGFYFGFLSPRNRFKTRHTLESFIRVQAKMWPVIAPIVKFNPTKASARKFGDPVPDKLPIFAEALSPEEWIAWHRIAVTNSIPDREAVRRAFLLQLGPRWNGIDGTPLYIKALFAAFALKGAQKRDESEALLGRFSTAWSPNGGLSLSSEVIKEIEDCIHNPKLGGQAKEVASHHAYRTTAMLEVLRWARNQGGVLAPGQFVWLRGLDRTLWYPMNNLGRRSFHTEGAGAMAHYMAERNAKKPLPIPRIDTAIVTLNQYFASSAQPIPPREGDPVKTRT